MTTAEEYQRLRVRVKGLMQLRRRMYRDAEELAGILGVPAGAVDLVLFQLAKRTPNGKFQTNTLAAQRQINETTNKMLQIPKG